MKKIISILIKIIIAVISIIFAGVSLLNYWIGTKDFQGEITRDNSDLYGTAIALIFGFIVFPIIINLVIDVGKTRQRASFVISKLTGTNYDPNNYKDDNYKDFEDLGVWTQSGSLVLKAYFKPLSIVLGLYLYYINLISPIFNTLTSGLESSYIIPQIIIKMIFTFPIITLYIFLNIRFYPWVKMWCMNIDYMNAIFPTSEGFIKTSLSNIKTVKKEYDQTPMNKYIRFSHLKKRGHTSNITVDKIYTKEDKRHEAVKMTVKQSYIYVLLRYGICLLLWCFSFILGWFAIPRIIRFIIENEEIKVIKNFYLNKKIKYFQTNKETKE